MKFSYSFEDLSTDRRNWFWNVLSKTFRTMYDTPTKAENKLAMKKKKKKKSPVPVILGGKHKYMFMWEIYFQATLSWQMPGI